MIGLYDGGRRRVDADALGHEKGSDLRSDPFGCVSLRKVADGFDVVAVGVVHDAA